MDIEIDKGRFATGTGNRVDELAICGRHISRKVCPHGGKIRARTFTHGMAIDWHENDDLYFTRGVICWNISDSGCYSTRRNQTQVFGPQILWRFKS